MRWIILIILFNAGLSTPNTNPGFRFQVTQKGINYRELEKLVTSLLDTFNMIECFSNLIAKSIDWEYRMYNSYRNRFM